MEATAGLNRVLSDLAHTYLDDDNEAGANTVDVEFTDDTPHADPQGPTVRVNPDVKDTYGKTVGDVTELRIVADTLAHEVAHVNHSDLGSKQEIAEANPDMPQAAGMVANILEDRYIDADRMADNPGQKATYKVKIDALMENHQRRPRVDTLDDKKGRVAALIETALQVTATGTPVDPDDTDGTTGWAKGIEEAPDDLQAFAVEWDDMANRVEDAHDLDHRLDVIQEGVDLLREYAPDDTKGRDMDDAAEEQGGDNLFDDDEAPDLDDLDMDPSDLERDQDVDQDPDQDVDQGPDEGPDPNDLDDLDDWDDQDGDGDDGQDPGGDDPNPDDAGEPGQDPGGDQGGGDDGDTGEQDPDGDQAGDAAGDGDDAEYDPMGDGDDAAAGDGEADTPDGDTERVDTLLGEYDPTDLEVRE